VRASQQGHVYCINGVCLGVQVLFDKSASAVTSMSSRATRSRHTTKTRKFRQFNLLYSPDPTGLCYAATRNAHVCVACHCADRLVDPNRGDVGFSPHRDRQPDDAPATFRADGSAMYATMWVPLTRATPENSCLYVIPR
jgi:hypothetical protein